MYYSRVIYDAAASYTVWIYVPSNLLTQTDPYASRLSVKLVHQSFHSPTAADKAFSHLIINLVAFSEVQCRVY
jgi:hypothetical protein